MCHYGSKSGICEENGSMSTIEISIDWIDAELSQITCNVWCLFGGCYLIELFTSMVWNHSCFIKQRGLNSYVLSASLAVSVVCVRNRIFPAYLLVVSTASGKEIRGVSCPPTCHEWISLKSLDHQQRFLFLKRNKVHRRCKLKWTQNSSLHRHTERMSLFWVTTLII